MKILVVDDEKEIRERLTSLLKTNNYEVENAESGKDAIEKLKHKRFDVLIVDFRLQDMTGIDVIEFAKKENMFMEVILMSACLDEVPKDKIDNIEMFEKPVKFSELLKILNKLK